MSKDRALRGRHFLMWVTFSSLDFLHAGDRIPRRGAVIRPDVFTGTDGKLASATFLWDDGAVTGIVERVEYFRDLTRDEPEVVRVQYKVFKGSPRTATAPA